MNPNLRNIRDIVFICLWFMFFHFVSPLVFIEHTIQGQIGSNPVSTLISPGILEKAPKMYEPQFFHV